MRWRIAGAAVALALAAIAFSWAALRNPWVNFLPAHAGAEWILFPYAVDIQAHAVVSLDTRFARDFDLRAQPQSADLHVRAMKRFVVTINGVPVEPTATANWKDAAEIRVASQLRTGTNTIEVRVFHDAGPPALWLELRADGVTLRSDEAWRVSLNDSAWRSAQLATNPRPRGAGNALAGGETTAAALRQLWPQLMGLSVLSAVLVVLGRQWIGAGSSARVIAIVSIVCALWVALFANSALLLPIHLGFDSQSHVDYIKYLQDHHALPWPNAGVQMFQPPLFYVVSAVVLSIGDLAADTPAGIVAVRGLTMFFGIAHFIVVFLSLRLVWPKQIGQQLVGLMLAAFLPMNLYLSQYCTNETLAALLIALAIYQCLYLLQQTKVTWWPVLGLGLTSGAAALTKFTGFLVIPAVMGALSIALWQRRASLAEWLKTGAVPVITLLVAGWHYLRLARHAGSLVIGGWDPAAGFVWWQDDGFRTAAYFARFGESLLRPFFSAGNSFADGIYATLWGDGLCGGVAALISRVPWNYQWMSAGYLLSVAPMMLVAIGFAVAISQWVRRGDPGRLLLTVFVFTVACGLLYLILTVPSYSSVKAFYGLGALVPLAFFGALGWDRITRGRRIPEVICGTLLMVWAMNSYAAVWLRDSAELHVYRGLRSLERQDTTAESEFSRAAALDSFNATPYHLLAAVSGETGHAEVALEQALRSVELAPADPTCHLELARVLDAKGDDARALEEVHRALSLGPEDAAAHRLLALCLLRAGANAEAITAARDGLAIAPFDADLHFSLATALARDRQSVVATNHFAYALLLRPTWAEARTNLHVALQSALTLTSSRQELERTVPDSATLLGEFAWLLATGTTAESRDGAQAVRVAERALRLTSGKTPEILATLAAAYGEAGRFPEAQGTATQALELARATGADEAATIATELLASFRQQKPFRETAVP